jgi:hypothetical protein
MASENQEPLSTGGCEEAIRSVVGEAWENTSVPRWLFVNILRNEAKVVGNYHEPGAYSQNEFLRQRLKRLFQSRSITRGEFARQLRQLADQYEQASPEAHTDGGDTS